MWEPIAGLMKWVTDQFLEGRRERRQRIQRVVDRYEELAGGRAPRDAGPSAFLRAGADDLRDDEEVREAIDRIMARVQDTRHPWGGFGDDVPERVNRREVVDRLVAGEEMREIVEDLTD